MASTSAASKHVGNCRSDLQQLPLGEDHGVAQVRGGHRGPGLLERRLRHGLGVDAVAGGGRALALGLAGGHPRGAGDLGLDLLDLDAEPAGDGSRVYSGRIELRRGSTRRSGRPRACACTRPSAVARSKRLIVVRTANSNIGTASSTRARTAASPLARRSSHGSMPARLDGDERLGGPALVLAEGAHRGLLPGRVAVEGEDHPGRREVGLVAHEAAQHLDVVVAERRAAGGDRALDAGEVAGHHVGVALDDDRLCARVAMAFFAASRP